jgi:hypothetical protein
VGTHGYPCLTSVNKHFWRRCREAIALDIFLVELSQFGEPSFSEFIPTPFLVYGVVLGFDSSIPSSHPLKSHFRWVLRPHVTTLR